MKPLFSIIVPVKNEGLLLEKFLQSAKKLNYPKRKIEVIIADGASTDNTKQIALKHGAKVVNNPKQTVAPGRNVAFKKAKGKYIAFSDADCLVDENWLSNSLKYFKNRKIAGVGGPNFTPPDANNFAKAVGFFMSQAAFLTGSIHGRNLPYIREVKSIPGCNSIYRKDILEKVMPLDESLLTCEETEMNQRILDLGYKLLTVPDVFVWHYHRSTPQRLAKQFYRWAIGRLQTGKKRGKMLNLIHVVVGLTIPIVIFLPKTFIVLGVIVLGLATAFLFALIKTKSLKIALNLPLVVLIVAFAWSVGFLRELLFPLKNPAGH